MFQGYQSLVAFNSDFRLSLGESQVPFLLHKTQTPRMLLQKILSVLHMASKSTGKLMKEGIKLIHNAWDSDMSYNINLSKPTSFLKIQFDTFYFYKIGSTGETLLYYTKCSYNQ